VFITSVMIMGNVLIYFGSLVFESSDLRVILK